MAWSHAMKTELHIQSHIYTGLYSAFLKSFIYDDVAFENNATELTLGTVVNEHRTISGHTNEDIAGHADPEFADVHDRHIFREDELFVYALPDRQQLSPAVTKRLKEEVDATLQTIAELFYTSFTLEDPRSLSISRLPEDLQGQVDSVNSMQIELNTLSIRLTELLGKARATREELKDELEQLICHTFPTFKASRNASIDLLAATVESTLQKLNSIRESARQSFYNHKVEHSQMNTETVSRAISIAYQALEEDEGALRLEARDLDRQIQEYETLLRLVDGSSGGYQQIVEDWVKIKRETDECLKDLRRLGWTGD